MLMKTYTNRYHSVALFEAYLRLDTGWFRHYTLVKNFLWACAVVRVSNKKRSNTNLNKQTFLPEILWIAGHKSCRNLAIKCDWNSAEESFYAKSWYETNPLRVSWSLRFLFLMKSSQTLKHKFFKVNSGLTTFFCVFQVVSLPFRRYIEFYCADF